jgi:hypothetical protein
MMEVACHSEPAAFSKQVRNLLLGLSPSSCQALPCVIESGRGVDLRIQFPCFGFYM